MLDSDAGYLWIALMVNAGQMSEAEGSSARTSFIDLITFPATIRLPDVLAKGGVRPDLRGVAPCILRMLHLCLHRYGYPGAHNAINQCNPSADSSRGRLRMDTWRPVLVMSDLFDHAGFNV